MFQLPKIFHVSHVVDDLDDACSWYDDMFSPRMWQRSELFGVPLALLVVGDVVFMPMAPSAELPSSAGRFKERFGTHLHSLALYVDDPDDLIAQLRGRGLRLTGAAGQDLTNPQDEIWTQPRESPMMFEFFQPRPSMNDPRLVEPDWSSGFWRDEHPLRIQDACTTLVTSDSASAVAFLVDALHGTVIHESASTPYATRSSFVSFSDEVTIEVAEPLDTDSRAGRDLEVGGKFHAVTLRVADLDRAVAHAISKGVSVDRPTDGHAVLDPAACLGVVFRLTDREGRGLVRQRDAEFESEGRTLRRWLFLPDEPGPHPGVVMSAGFAGVKEGFLGHPYHEVFADGGIASLLYDHANCGDSDGEPRQELDPVLQQRGYKDTVTFLCGSESVDAGRIGIWGTSYSGGHVLGVTATDRRVRCVVSQAMTISGHGNLIRRHTPARYAELRQRWEHDRLGRAAGDPPLTVSAFGENSDSMAFAMSRPPEHRVNWRNEITVRSWELYDEYEPAALVERIAPTPLLMIVCLDDVMTPAEDALAAYARALEPKRLVTVRGGHYAAYVEQFERTSTAARDWFVEHLVH